MLLAGTIDVAYEPTVTTKYDLRVILEANLNNFVVQAEHNRMLCPHPLFHHYQILFDAGFWAKNTSLHYAVKVACRCGNWLFWVAFVLELIFAPLQVLRKMLHQEDFLLDLLWCIFDQVLLNLLLTTSGVSLNVGHVLGRYITKHFRVIIEVDTTGAI